MKERLKKSKAKTGLTRMGNNFRNFWDGMETVKKLDGNGKKMTWEELPRAINR